MEKQTFSFKAERYFLHASEILPRGEITRKAQSELQSYFEGIHCDYSLIALGLASFVSQVDLDRIAYMMVDSLSLSRMTGQDWVNGVRWTPEMADEYTRELIKPLLRHPQVGEFWKFVKQVGIKLHVGGYKPPKTGSLYDYHPGIGTKFVDGRRQSVADGRIIRNEVFNALIEQYM